MAISDPCPTCRNMPCTCGYIGDPAIRWDTVEPYVWKKQRDALLAAAKAVLAAARHNRGFITMMLVPDKALDGLRDAVKEVEDGK